jgi:hypothetical protein
MICLPLSTRVSDKILPHIASSLCRALEASFLRKHQTSSAYPTPIVVGHKYCILFIPASANHPVYTSIRHRSILTSRQRLPTWSYQNQVSDHMLLTALLTRLLRSCRVHIQCSIRLTSVSLSGSPPRPTVQPVHWEHANAIVYSTAVLVNYSIS